ncbi:hypothetical protein [Streptomyces sp. AC627_RSS907]|uniref:hypothetical protein n=1 Tax=Streptomyces sp. AC627_RSS907 TaxID=2823684 RepID=UPI0035B14601
MTTRIIDVAHTVAAYRTAPGPHQDLSAARQAVATGLDVDHTAELLYRDWCRLEHAAGNRQGLHTAVTRIQQVNRELDCSLETETGQLIKELLNDTDSGARARPCSCCSGGTKGRRLSGRPTRRSVVSQFSMDASDGMRSVTHLVAAAGPSAAAWVGSAPSWCPLSSN